MAYTLLLSIIRKIFLLVINGTSKAVDAISKDHPFLTAHIHQIRIRVS
jgi:hypothetical protein